MSAPLLRYYGAYGLILGGFACFAPPVLAVDHYMNFEGTYAPSGSNEASAILVAALLALSSLVFIPIGFGCFFAAIMLFKRNDSE